MDIAKIDSNFSIPSSVTREDLVWIEATDAQFSLYGAVGANPYLRMPAEIAKAVSSGVEKLSRNTAGVRLRLRTDSPFIAIHVEWDQRCRMAHMPFLGISGFDLYRVRPTLSKQAYVGSYIPWEAADAGFESIVETPFGMTDYVLNFPLYNNVTRLWIGLQKGSRAETPARYINERPVVFYGSSITQGGCASRPGNCYQNFLSRALDFDYVNLGFSGNGRAEDTMIEYLTGLEMSVFVSDYDYNAPNPEHLERTHEKLYKAIRCVHPDIPYIMISKPNFKYTEDNSSRRAIIMRTYQNALEAGDKNVYFLDGASIFAGEEWDACTVDGCHPNDLGFYRFYKALLPIFEVALN